MGPALVPQPGGGVASLETWCCCFGCAYLADGVEGAEDGVVEVTVGHQQVDVLHHAVLEHRPDLVRVGIAHLKGEGGEEGLGEGQVEGCGIREKGRVWIEIR